MLPRKIKNYIVERASDVQAPFCLIYTQIIYVECFDICQDIVVQMLLKNTERISQQTVILVNCGKDRTFFVSQDFP